MLLPVLILAQVTATLPFPDWDVDASCGTMPPAPAKACVESEQSAYESLKEQWPRLSDPERRLVTAYASKLSNYRYSTAERMASSLIERDEAQHPIVPRFQR